ncbi:MAG: 3-hydroxylacyl-ACP dehydratase [Gammaproteobacteria bacterium]|nr:3-hydroxylacyl-ACP dehydratase [Gammaproteobacteria bacterium]
MTVEGSWVLEELLPHAHPMILIDTISEPDPGSLSSTVRISEDCPFYQAPGGVPSYVGIEYIAQTVAALAGLKARRAGREVALGFLLGTRRLQATVPYFVLGSELSIRVDPEFESPELAKYRGEVRDESGNLVVTTAVTVYSGGKAGTTDSM